MSLRIRSSYMESQASAKTMDVQGPFERGGRMLMMAACPKEKIKMQKRAMGKAETLLG